MRSSCFDTPFGYVGEMAAVNRPGQTRAEVLVRNEEIEAGWGNFWSNLEQMLKPSKEQYREQREEEGNIAPKAPVQDSEIVVNIDDYNRRTHRRWFGENIAS